MHMDDAFNIGDLLQTLTIVGSVAVTILVVGKWFGRTDTIVSGTVDQLAKIEQAVEKVEETISVARDLNTKEHTAIIQHVDSHPVHSIVAAHGERIARIEAGIDKKDKP